MYHYNATMIRVIDGDTYEVEADLGFRIFYRLRVRLRGVDTPEIYRPSCEAEFEHGAAAKAFVERLIPVGARLEIRTYKDVAGIFNRWEAEVWVGEESIEALLVINGMEKRESYE
jgi:micrococcal nuclease